MVLEIDDHDPLLIASFPWMRPSVHPDIISFGRAH
jgi:hypothetical protein